MLDVVGIDVQRHRPAVAHDFDLGVAVAAQAILVGHAFGVVDLTDLVRRVAIDAGRDDLRLLLPELAANHLAMNGLDLRMAAGAGGSDVLTGDG